MSQNDTATKLMAGLKHLPAKDLTRVMTAFSEARVELAKTERDVIRIEAARDVLITELNLKYAAIHSAMSAIFGERKSALDQYFAVIERGIAKDDRAMIVSGMDGVGKLVSTSPFANLDSFAKLLESKSKIEI